MFFFFKQKTADELRMSDWSSDVCSSDLDDDVVGPVDGGWTGARATLGNESGSIGGGDGCMSLPGSALIEPCDANPERLEGGAVRVGRYIADHQAMGLLNLRSANRAVEGSGPGPEGAMTKLILSEIGHEAAAILTELNGPDAAFMDGTGFMSNSLVLMHRGMSIAGGTSHDKRNQIRGRVGRYSADHQDSGLLNRRSANRGVEGSCPGPEGAMTKLIRSEIGHDAAAILTELNGPDAAFMDGPGFMSNSLVLMHRGMSIAGGTSEIKRNQIGERIAGLPRDPLIK